MIHRKQHVEKMASLEVRIEKAHTMIDYLTDNLNHIISLVKEDKRTVNELLDCQEDLFDIRCFLATLDQNHEAKRDRNSSAL